MSLTADLYFKTDYTKKQVWWMLLSAEERSWVLLRACNAELLSAEEVKPFLRKDVLNNVFTNVLPLAAFPLVYWSIPKVSYTWGRSLCKHSKYQLALFGTLPFFILWRRYNPFRVGLSAEKERLLETLFKRVGGTQLVNLNEMLPRWMTEFEIHRKLRVLVSKKKGLFSNILYPGEDRKAMEIAIDPFEPFMPNKKPRH